MESRLFSDGFGIMRDARTAKPQAFRTGNGWFPYNLATNLAANLGRLIPPMELPRTYDRVFSRELPKEAPEEE